MKVPLSRVMLKQVKSAPVRTIKAFAIQEDYALCSESGIAKNQIINETAGIKTYQSLLFHSWLSEW